MPPWLATIDHRSRFQSAPKPTASAILQPATYWPIVSLMLSSPQCLDSPLPERFGDWKNVHRRFSRWAKSGVWERVFQYLAADADNEYAR